MIEDLVPSFLAQHVAELCTVAQAQVHQFLLANQFIIAIVTKRLSPFLEVLNEDGSELLRFRVGEVESLLDILAHLIADLLVAFVLIVVILGEEPGATDEEEACYE